MRHHDLAREHFQDEGKVEMLDANRRASIYQVRQERLRKPLPNASSGFHQAGVFSRPSALRPKAGTLMLPSLNRGASVEVSPLQNHPYSERVILVSHIDILVRAPAT